MADGDQNTDHTDDDETTGAQGSEVAQGDAGTGGEAKPTAPSWTPPTREEWERVTASLTAANAESRKRKEELRRIAAESATEEEKRAAEIADKTRAEVESTWRPRFVASEARAALSSAGCKDPGRFARLIDAANLDVGDDGSVTGLSDQVAALKADFPEAFRRERQSTATGDGVAVPGGTRPPTQRRSASQRQADLLLGRA